MALVPLSLRYCPDCAADVERSTWAQLVLVRHGGYGADLEVVVLSCSECAWWLEVSRTERNPRR